MHSSEKAAITFRVKKTQLEAKQYFAKSNKIWLEAYRNAYLHFIDPGAAVAV